MDKQKIKEFLSNPAVKEIMKTGGMTQVALAASSLGNLSRSPDLREFANRLTKKLSEAGFNAPSAKGDSM